MSAVVRKLRTFLRKQPVDMLTYIQYCTARLKSRLFYAPQFAHFGKGSVIIKPMMISNPRFISIGDRVTIRSGVRLEAVVADDGHPPQLVIGNNVNIEQDVHIVAIGKVMIGDNVSLTARCSILGGGHPFFDVHDKVKIGARLTGQTSKTVIGDGCFLGVGAAIAMNVKLGKRTVVGTNSVVKQSFPDDVVLEGNPARVVLSYDAASDRWTAAAPPQKNVSNSQ